MAQVILMPLLSDTVTEGIITTWYKKVGESVKAGEVLAEIETDKATMELGSDIAGTLLYIAGNKGDRISVDDTLCIVGQPGEDISHLVLNKRIEQESAKQLSDNLFFLSYSRTDAEFAIKLANDIRSAGKKIWIDKLDIKPGKPWHKEIQNALKNSKSILVILSQSSVDSDNVLNEVYYAIDKGKDIIPIKIDECEIPFGLHRLHYIDFKTNYNESLKQLLATLAAV